MTPYAQIAKRLPGFLYKLAAQSYIDRVYPRHLFIETTAHCNLSCSFCPREKITSDMDFGLFRKIIDEASQYGARSFSLHLFGEPLLYSRIFEAICYIKQRNRRHTVLLTTNGTKVNECVNELVSSKVDQVFWTWRREAKFGVSTLLKLNRWGKFRIRFIDEITPDEARKEWAEWKNVEGRRMHNYGGEIDTGKWPKSTEKSMDQEKKETSGLTASQVQPLRESFSLRKNSLKWESRWPCYHLWLAPAISWNGKFLMCCADPHQREVFGDVTKENVSVGWKRVERVRQSHLRGEYKGICESCDVWKEYPDIFFKGQKRG